MKKNSRLLVRLVIFGLLAAALFFVWRGTANVFVKLFTMLFAVLFCEGLFVALLRFLRPASHRGQTVVTLISSLGKYVAAIVILCWGLSILGVNVSGILASVGILTLVVGFSAESLIADVITGFFMLFENQYNVGDIVEVNGFRGTVKEIGIRTTSIIDMGKNIKVINNSDMKNILNRSDNVSIGVSTIDVPYSTDLEALEKAIPALMQDIYSRHQDVMLSAPRYLGVQELGSSGITLKFIVEVEESNIFSAPRTLNRELLLGFRRLGVECPYPQLDVHSR